MRDKNYLFIQYDLRASLEKEEKQMFTEIDGIEPNRLLNTSIEDLAKYYKDKFTHVIPQLLEDKITMDQGETQIDVSQDFDRGMMDRSRPYYLTGTKFTFFVPFTGEGDLFNFRSSMIPTNPPCAVIGDHELIITVSLTNHDAQVIKTQFDNTLSQIKQLLTGTTNDIGIYNNGIKQKAENHIKKRREKLLKDQGLAAELGFQLRRRDDMPTTYTVPVVPRKVVPQMPPASSTPFKPEPTLEWGEYEHILTILSGMVNVMERSPKSFATMKEEDIRQQFLVQLNGQYQGKATGETFNESGKTDILIRDGDKNIFIAECKFWEGQEVLLKAVSQLLGYTTWRDTKTALIIFNRNKNLSDVLSKIPDIIKLHPNFKKQLEYKSETGFRFVLHHNDDKNREIFVTVLIFDVPIIT